MTPELTVIIVNWNGRELLLECLRTLERAVSIEYSCVVVDNGSRDGSADAVAVQFPGVKLVRNESNLGFARANNLALAELATEFALLLNADARPKPGAVEAMLDAMKENAKAGVVGANLLHEDGTPQNSFDNFPTLSTELFNKSLLRALFPGRYAGKSTQWTEPAEVDSVIGACMLIRAAALARTGPFDEAFFFFKEETDLCLRMKLAGWQVVHHPGAKVVHLQGKSKQIAPLAAKIEYDRSNIVFFKKYRGDQEAQLLRAGRVVKLAANILLGSIAVLCTLGFNRRVRRRVSVYRGLLAWHLSGRPDGPGLRTVDGGR